MSMRFMVTQGADMQRACVLCSVTTLSSTGITMCLEPSKASKESWCLYVKLWNGTNRADFIVDGMFLGCHLTQHALHAPLNFSGLSLLLPHPSLLPSELSYHLQ